MAVLKQAYKQRNVGCVQEANRLRRTVVTTGAALKVLLLLLLRCGLKTVSLALCAQ